MTARRASVGLPVDVSAPRFARRFVAETMRSWGANGLVDTGELLASELVTNALRYGGGSSQIVVIYNGVCIRLEVTDRGPGGAERQSPRLEDVGGRGLLLVDAMASRGGAAPVDGAHVVWCEMTK